MKQFFKLGSAIFASLIVSAPLQASDLFPGGNSSFYYRIGGGRDVPRAAVYNTTTLDIGLDESIGLGYNCGAFDPKATIEQSLNKIKESVHHVSGDIMSRATGAITQFPMYMLIRANPKLYNLLNNSMLGAVEQFSLKMKSCESMQAEAAQGENPYKDWISFSTANHWKEKMGKSNAKEKDLNVAKKEVDDTQGDKGVPWVTPGGYAGGKGQTPIFVIRDTSVAGFNVLAGRISNPSDTSPVKPDEKNARLTHYWKSPTEAGKWIASVTGDQKITTCKECKNEKNSSPGLGLLPSNQTIAQKISEKMSKLVSGGEPLNKENLNAISAPGIVISSAVIRTIQKMDPNQRALVIDKISGNVATAITADMGLLAKRILQTGAQVPAIRAAKPAQREIQDAIQKITSDMNDLLAEVNMRRQLISDPLTEILEQDNENTKRAFTLPKSSETVKPLTDGGDEVNQK